MSAMVTPLFDVIVTPFCHTKSLRRRLADGRDGASEGEHEKYVAKKGPKNKMTKKRLVSQLYYCAAHCACHGGTVVPIMVPPLFDVIVSPL